MSKIREVTISGNEYFLDTIIGYDGEHKITNLNIKLPSELISDDIDHYTVEFQTQNGDVISSGNIQQNGGYVVVSPWQDVMVFGQLKFQVTAWAMTGDTIDKIAKSPVITRLVGESVDGDAVLLDENVGGLMVELQQLIANYPVMMGTFTAGEEWDFELVDGLLNIVYVPATDGEDGLNGITPEIGENGNWFIDGVDTGILADVSLTDLSGYELKSNKVTSIDSESTDEEYVSAKLIYTQLLSKLSAEYPEIPTQSNFLRDDGVFAEVSVFDNADVLAKFTEENDQLYFDGLSISGVNVARYNTVDELDTNEDLIIAQVTTTQTDWRSARRKQDANYTLVESPKMPIEDFTANVYKNGELLGTMAFYANNPFIEEEGIGLFLVNDIGAELQYCYAEHDWTLAGSEFTGEAGWVKVVFEIVDGEYVGVSEIIKLGETGFLALPHFNEIMITATNGALTGLQEFITTDTTDNEKTDLRWIREEGIYIVNADGDWRKYTSSYIADDYNRLPDDAPIGSSAITLADVEQDKEPERFEPSETYSTVYARLTPITVTTGGYIVNANNGNPETKIAEVEGSTDYLNRITTNYTGGGGFDALGTPCVIYGMYTTNPAYYYSYAYITVETYTDISGIILTKGWNKIHFNDIPGGGGLPANLTTEHLEYSDIPIFKNFNTDYVRFKDLDFLDGLFSFSPPITRKAGGYTKLEAGWEETVCIDPLVEVKANKVTTIDANSTDEQYPSAKLIYTELLSKLSAEYPEIPTQSNFLRDDGVFAEVYETVEKFSDLPENGTIALVQNDEVVTQEQSDFDADTYYFLFVNPQIPLDFDFDFEVGFIQIESEFDNDEILLTLKTTELSHPVFFVEARITDGQNVAIKQWYYAENEIIVDDLTILKGWSSVDTVNGVITKNESISYTDLPNLNGTFVEANSLGGTYFSETPYNMNKAGLYEFNDSWKRVDNDKSLWCESTGFLSTANGYGTTASGTASTANGEGTMASGYAATANGMSTTASGYAATANGVGTTASGYAATANGVGTTASGDGATANGYGTTASGTASTANGVGTTASGYAAASFGNYTDAKHDNSTIVGEFGETDTDTLFAVANGTSIDNKSLALNIKPDEAVFTIPVLGVTADALDSSTKLATTAFVQGEIDATKEYVDENAGSTALTELTGSVLSVGNFYKTISESVSFTLPTADTSKSNLIMLDLKVVGDISIALGTTYAANMSVPLMVAGNYLVSWEYSNIVGDWIVTVLPYGVIV